MSVRQAQTSGAGAAPDGADAREKLVAAVHEAVARISREGGGYVSKNVLPGVTIVAESPYGKQVKVSFTDEMVDEFSGRLSKGEVKWVKVEVLPEGCRVYLGTRLDPPATWRPSQHLALLPDAFNAALSALGVGELLEKEFGVRLAARGVSVRRMHCLKHYFYLGRIKRAPVVLVSFDVNGEPLTVNALALSFDPEGGEAVLEFDALLRHGDRKLTRRLYVLSWLDRKLWDALRKLKEEGKVRDFRKIYDESGKLDAYVVNLGDREVVITHPEGDCNRHIDFVDEEYIVYHRKLRIERGRGGKIGLEAAAKKWLEEVEEESSRLLASLKQDVRKLLRSGDPRLKELGHLLACLIIQAYREAQAAIPI
jgi:hypothetical protein